MPLEALRSKPIAPTKIWLKVPSDQVLNCEMPLEALLSEINNTTKNVYKSSVG